MENEEEYATKADRIWLYDQNRYSKTAGYICWLIGMHYLYLGNIGTWILFIITGGGIGIWRFIDLFRLYDVINSRNRALMIRYKLKAEDLDAHHMWHYGGIE